MRSSNEITPSKEVKEETSMLRLSFVGESEKPTKVNFYRYWVEGFQKLLNDGFKLNQAANKTHDACRLAIRRAFENKEEMKIKNKLQ